MRLRAVDLVNTVETMYWQHQHTADSNWQHLHQQHGPNQPAHMAGPSDAMSEDNRRVLEWIAQVLNANTRESALLELSKKREQVPELALILWHSFGTRNFPPSSLGRLGLTRCAQAS